MLHRLLSLAAAVCLVACAGVQASVQADRLPSWNPGPTRDAVVGFVERVTAQGSADFVPPAERIAVFDNDGTLWSEQPLYFQLAFAIDRVKALAPEHPEWKTQQPFRAVLEKRHGAPIVCPASVGRATGSCSRNPSTSTRS